MKKENIFLIFILLLFAACSSTDSTPKGLAKFNESRDIPDDMALIYFFKPEAEFGNPVKVLVNSIELANVNEGEYFPVYVPKGEALIQVQRIGLFSKESKNKIVYLAEGRTYYVGVGVKGEKSYIIPVEQSKEIKAKTELISYNLKKPLISKLPLDPSRYEMSKQAQKKIISSAQAKTFETALELLVVQLTEKISGNPKKNIAILPFRTIGEKDEDIEFLLSEELITRIVLTDKFNVVERNLLEKVMEENQFSQTDLVDEADAVEIGKLLGADLVCTGTLATLRNNIKINSRIISISTGRVETVGATTISKSGF